MDNKLSICIPTYNRERQLFRLLHSIESERIDLIEEILLLDNCSNYSIEEVAKTELPESIINKTRIIRNLCNIGGSSNIKNLYLFCRTKWMWMLGDDDYVLHGCIETIISDIENYPDCGQFRYSIQGQVGDIKYSASEDDVTMNTIQDFIDYYSTPGRHKGNMVFMSNNVVNMEKLKPFFQYAFDYSTCISQIVPALMALDAQKVYIRYRSVPIVKYIHPENGTQWNMFRIMLSLSTIKFLPFKSLSARDINKLLDIFVFIPFSQFATWCNNNRASILRLELIKEVWTSHYKYRKEKRVENHIRFIALYWQYKTGFRFYLFVNKLFQYKDKVFSIITKSINEFVRLFKRK